MLIDGGVQRHQLAVLSGERGENGNAGGKRWLLK